MKNDLKIQINHNIKTIENLFNHENTITKIIKQISNCLKNLVPGGVVGCSTSVLLKIKSIEVS